MRSLMDLIMSKEAFVITDRTVLGFYQFAKSRFQTFANKDKVVIYDHRFPKTFLFHLYPNITLTKSQLNHNQIISNK